MMSFSPQSMPALRRLAAVVVALCLVGCTKSKLNGEAFVGGDELDAAADFTNDIRLRLLQIATALGQIRLKVGIPDLYPSDADCRQPANDFCAALAPLDNAAQRRRVADELVAAANGGAAARNARPERFELVFGEPITLPVLGNVLGKAPLVYDGPPFYLSHETLGRRSLRGERLQATSHELFHPHVHSFVSLPAGASEGSLPEDYLEVAPEFPGGAGPEGQGAKRLLDAMGRLLAAYVKKYVDVGGEPIRWTLASGLRAGVSVVVSGSGRVLLFTVGDDNAVYVAELGDSLTWHRLGGRLTSEPSVTTLADGESMVAFGRDADRHLVRAIFSKTKDSWTGWIPMASEELVTGPDVCRLENWGHPPDSYLVTYGAIRFGSGAEGTLTERSFVGESADSAAPGAVTYPLLTEAASKRMLRAGYPDGARPISFFLIPVPSSDRGTVTPWYQTFMPSGIFVQEATGSFPGTPPALSAAGGYDRLAYTSVHEGKLYVDVSDEPVYGYLSGWLQLSVPFTPASRAAGYYPDGAHLVLFVRDIDGNLRQLTREGAATSVSIRSLGKLP